jgi:hypothetical protein
MFVGHYAASLALKKFEKRASLGVLFLAVQFVDILFFPLVLLGIERVNIIENYTQSTHFQLEYMPFTHSLVGSILWAVLAYALFRWVLVKDKSVALVVAIVVFMLLMNIGNVFGPLQTDSKVVMSVSALAAYFLFAAVAFWLDKKRI